MFSFWYYYICILCRSSRREVFLKKVFLKNSQNSQEINCTGVFFLSAASNLINEETPTQCFPKPLTIFTKSFFVDIRRISTHKWVINTHLYCHGVIILNRSSNFVFLYLKIYWNRQVFDLIRASGIWMKPETLRHQAYSSEFQILFLKVLIWV